MGAPMKKKNNDLPRHLQKYLDAQQEEEGCKEIRSITDWAKMFYGKQKLKKRPLTIDCMIKTDTSLCRQCVCAQNNHGHRDCSSECCGKRRCLKCLHRHPGTECRCRCLVTWIEYLQEDILTAKTK